MLGMAPMTTDPEGYPMGYMVKAFNGKFKSTPP